MMHTLVAYLATATLLGSTAQPIADVFVDLNAANCAAGTGTVADPVCSIGAAIAIAAPGDTIRIAPGTYVENVQVALDLGFVGTAGPDVTVIDGGQAGSVITIPAAVLVTIDGLRVTNGRATQGGGFNVLGTLALTNSTVDSNQSTASGGGMWIGPGSDVSVVASTIRDNRTGDEAFGGGILMVGADLVIRDSTIAHNFVPSYYYDCYATGGGGIAALGGTLTVSGSTIADNSSECEGGGLWTDTTLVMTNSTISGNHAAWAGAMYAVNFQLESVTVTRNAADIGYVGPFVEGILALGAGTRTLHNCIVAANSNRLFGTDLDGTFTSLGHNFIGTGGNGFVDGLNGDVVGTHQDRAVPGLSWLRDNGGLTATHVPLFGSPVLNAGDPLSFEQFDQRGTARPIGALPDIGAVEFEPDNLNLCNGDGGDQMGCTDCPCNNAAPPGSLGGCLNSSGVGARLDVSGSPSVSLAPMSTNDLRFGLSGAISQSVAILMSGHTIGPLRSSSPCRGQQTGSQSLAFDGLRCVVWFLRRHGTRQTDANGSVGQLNSPWGGEAGPSLGIAQAHGGFVAGQTRYFQAIYRDSSLAVCMTGLNTTQAIGVIFSP